MKKVMFLGLVALFSVSVWADENTGWGTDVTNALQVAKANRRPVLLEFSAPWCPYCRQMESKTFKDQAVEKSLEQFERVTVNIDRNPSLAVEHAVRGIPAFVVLDSEGEEVAKTSGFMEAVSFHEWLAAGVTNLTESTAQKEDFQNRTNEVESALGSADVATRAHGLVLVLDCCGRREKSYRTFGEEKLRAIAKIEPRLLLEGLNHPGLMARIRVANLLREKFGEGFRVDPWDGADVRQREVREWQARLRAEVETR